MKTYNQFMREAYSKRYGDIDEGLGSAARWAIRGVRAVPGLGTAASLGYAGYKLAKGDTTGAALAAGSAIPGPVGYGFLAADIAREVAKSQKGNQKQPPTSQKPSSSNTNSTKPSPTSSSPTSQKPSSPNTNSTKPSPTSSTVLAKKGGVQGTLDKSTGKFTTKKWSDSESSRYSKVKSSQS